jgi:hypothetical protein
MNNLIPIVKKLTIKIPKESHCFQEEFISKKRKREDSQMLFLQYTTTVNITRAFGN